MLKPRGHRAVPARAGRPAHARARRHRAQGGELHGLHAVRALSAPTGASTSRATRRSARRAVRAAATRTVSVLDRFDIDYALCMYCGICVEVCPFDALFWSPEYEYSESNIAKLLHDKEQARRVDGDRPRARAARDRRRGQGKKYVVAQNVAFWILAVAMAARRDRRRALAERRARRALPRRRARAAPPRSTSCSPPSSSPGCRCSSTSAPSSSCSCSASCSPARRCGAEGEPRQQPALAAAVVGAVPVRRAHRAARRRVRRQGDQARRRARADRQLQQHRLDASSATTSCRSRSSRCCSSPRSSAPS